AIASSSSAASRSQVQGSHKRRPRDSSRTRRIQPRETLSDPRPLQLVSRWWIADSVRAPVPLENFLNESRLARGDGSGTSCEIAGLVQPISQNNSRPPRAREPILRIGVLVLVVAAALLIAHVRGWLDYQHAVEHVARLRRAHSFPVF